MSRMHFSLDDVKGIFKFLITDHPESIFDSRTLKFLEGMHEVYGIDVDMYCTYQDKWYSIEKIPDKYRTQFENNRWLHFGYHCFSENHTENPENFGENYGSFCKIIKIITGQYKAPDYLRLDNFAGTKEMCRYIRRSGIDYILTADDLRNSYYLSDEECRILNQNKKYYDLENDICFIRSCTRLENIEQIGFLNFEKEIDSYKENNCNIIPVFTHEWQMDRNDIRDLFEKCCRLSREIVDSNDVL